MKQKTKVFQLRLTPEEAQLLKEKSGSFHSVSHYILSAVQEFSNVDVRERIELIRELGEFYRKNQNELSWVIFSLMVFSNDVLKASCMPNRRIWRSFSKV